MRRTPTNAMLKSPALFQAVLSFFPEAEAIVFLPVSYPTFPESKTAPFLSPQKTKKTARAGEPFFASFLATHQLRHGPS